MDAIQRKLRLVSIKLKEDDYDIRHAVLDIIAEFEDVAAASPRFPQRLQSEVKSIAAELDDLKPAFPSHPKTSVLFDRAGLGQAGFKRARDVAQRIVALAKIVVPGDDD